MTVLNGQTWFQTDLFRFVMDKVAFGQVSLRTLQFSLVSIIPQGLHTHLYLITSTIRRISGRSLGIFEQSDALSYTVEHCTYFHFTLLFFNHFDTYFFIFFSVLKQILRCLPSSKLLLQLLKKPSNMNSSTLIPLLRNQQIIFSNYAFLH
jgi:hypothetical protein